MSSDIISFRDEFKKRKGIEIVDDEIELAPPHPTDGISLEGAICPDCGSHMPMMRSATQPAKRVCVLCTPLFRT